MNIDKWNEQINYFKSCKLSLYLADENTHALYDVGLTRTVVLYFLMLFLMFYMGFFTAYYILNL